MHTWFVYLLHYDKPLTFVRGGKTVNVQHYMGSAKDVEERINQHKNGTSRCKLPKAFFDAGIGFQIVQVWDSEGLGGRLLERGLKKGKNLKRICPLCRGPVR